MLRSNDGLLELDEVVLRPVVGRAGAADVVNEVTDLDSGLGIRQVELRQLAVRKNVRHHRRYFVQPGDNEANSLLWPRCDRDRPRRSRPRPTFARIQFIELSNYLLANFRGHVLACIDAKFRSQILV